MANLQIISLTSSNNKNNSNLIHQTMEQPSRISVVSSRTLEETQEEYLAYSIICLRLWAQRLISLHREIRMKYPSHLLAILQLVLRWINSTCLLLKISLNLATPTLTMGSDSTFLSMKLKSRLLLSAEKQFQN